MSIPALFKTQRNHSLPSAGLRRKPLITSIARLFDHSSHGFEVERGFADFGAQSEDLCIHGAALLLGQNIFLAVLRITAQLAGTSTTVHGRNLGDKS
jgi:hypothetical protein